MLQRSINPQELKQVFKGTIPFFDYVYPFQNGYAKTLRKGKFGVINSRYEIVLQNEFDDVTIMDNHMLITFCNNEFQIYTNSGFKLTNRTFRYMSEAYTYANFF